ncbi:hypothetical protein LTR85_003336 [Meristemomyces frigidus]|nr:hypothetical protein LTR85_003336 [Meristemomyces frigidus]
MDAADAPSGDWPPHPPIIPQVSGVHRPLKSRHHIRLFSLDPATDFHAHISGRLLLTDVRSGKIEYETLSYVWGSTARTQPISVDGLPYNVTINLHDALRRLRSATDARVVWIDAICIDQLNNTERSAQVSLMADIYTSASRVCVWLGESVGDAHLVFDHIATWKARCRKRKAEGTFGSSDDINRPDYKGAVLKAYEDMLQREWFTRTWVIQEMCLGRNAAVLCGPYEEEWELMWDRSSRGGGFKFHPLTRETPKDRANMMAAIQDVLQYSAGRKVRLHDVATVFQYSNLCGASEPRDKVYGTLALFEGRPVKVDYNKSIPEVYQEFTKAVIFASESLSLLHMAGTKRTLGGLPSWVPDFSVTAPLGIMPDATNRSFTSGHSDNTGWTICKTIHGEADTQITLTGKKVDVCTVVSSALIPEPENFAGSDHFPSTVCAWAAMATQHACGSSKQSLMHAFAATCLAKRLWDRSGNVEHTRWRDEHCFLEWYKAYGGDAFPSEYVAALQRHVDAYKTHIVLEPSSCVEEYASVMEPVCYGRAMFDTTSGTIGLAPPDTQPGDSVVFLAGGFCPFVLRLCQGGAWTLIGDCYLYGLDPFVLWDDATKRLEQFTLR